MDKLKDESELKKEKQKTKTIHVKQMAKTYNMQGERKKFTSTRNFVKKIGKNTIHDNTQKTRVEQLDTINCELIESMDIKYK